MTEGLITPIDLSQRLHISLRSLERMRSDCSGPAFIRVTGGKKRGRIAYSEAAVQAWLSKQTVG
jgi:hypothetical protein